MKAKSETGANRQSSRKTSDLPTKFHRQRKILLLIKWSESINIINYNIQVLCILVNVLSVMERTLNEYVYSGRRYIRRDHWYGRALSVIYVVQISINCRNQKLLLPSDSDPCRLSSESGALSSSTSRHIDFHLLRLIYVAFVAHSIALSLQQAQILENTTR